MLPGNSCKRVATQAEALSYPDSDDYTAPMRHPFDTAVLFADVSGFTAMTEKLSELGSVGNL